MTQRPTDSTSDLPGDLLSVISRSSSRLASDFAGLASLVVMLLVALNLPDLL